jgi:hypothetical protein
MAAWSENDVRVGRIGPDGSALDGAGIVVSQAPVRPAGLQILFDGSRYIVFWIWHNSLFARYVKRDGTPDGDTFRVSPAGDSVAAFSAAWTGAAYALAWWPSSYQPAVLSVMLPSGPVIAVPTPVIGGETAVSGGPRPLAIGVSTTFRGVNAVLLDNGIWFSLFTTPGGYLHALHLASNGRDYVLTWTQSRFVIGKGYENEVWAARIDGMNLVGSAIPITTIVSAQDVAGEAIPLFDGSRYRIVYAGSTLGEAVLREDSFTCHCFEHSDTALDIAGMKHLSATIGAGGSVIAYARPVTPLSEATHDNVFVRFAREMPTRRHAAGN